MAIGSATLRAALRWVTYLQRADAPRALALFTNHPRFADLAPAQYLSGLIWLRETGLLGRGDRLVPMDPESAFQIFLDAAERMRPGRVEAALAEVLAAGQVFGLGGDNPEAAVMTVSGKIDLERRVRTGEAGEAGLLQMLRQGGWSARQVSLEADGFGYDIAATDVAGGELHLEVKSTTAIRGYVVHLSRHEFHIMCADPSWRMIAVRLDGHDQVQDVATVSREWIAQAVPMDRDGGGRWESVRLVIPDCEVVPGISGLGPPGTCCDGARDLVGLLGS